MVSKFKSLSKHSIFLAIVIPMFNEEDVCGKCIDAVVKELKKLSISSKIIAIDDGSSDTTLQILQQKQKQYKQFLTVLTHKMNKGFGAATQSGIQEALKQNVTWILHMDSDLTNDPKYIHEFLKVADENVDCIKASRYIYGAKVKNVSLKRRAISFVGNYIAHFLFGVGIIDCTNGFRMVRTEKIKGLKFKQQNFSIILEELYYLKKAKAKFKEIPYTLTARTTTHSHFSYKPTVFIDYFKYALLSFFV